MANGLTAAAAGALLAGDAMRKALNLLAGDAVLPNLLPGAPPLLLSGKIRGLGLLGPPIMEAAGDEAAAAAAADALLLMSCEALSGLYVSAAGLSTGSGCCSASAGDS